MTHSIARASESQICVGWRNFLDPRKSGRTLQTSEK